MGEKNQVAQTEGDNDLLVKSGHSILKAIYTGQTGDRQWIVRDGASVCPAIGTVTIACPLVNVFSTGTITTMCVQEELTACGTITVATALEEVAACGTITVGACLVSQEHADQTVVFCCPTLRGTSCGTITLAAVAVGRTVCVNGRTYTAVCGTKCDHTEFNIAGTDCVDAVDLLDSLNNDVRCIPGCNCACGTTATVMCAVITVTSVALAAASNCITLTSSDACDLAISACGFTGGKDDDNVTVNGLVYTATCGAHACDFTLFDISVACCAISTDFTLSVNCDVRMCPTDAAVVDATSCCVTTTVRAVTAGVAGNCFSLATNAVCCTIVVGGACFTGGLTGDFVTLNGLVYTANEGAKADDTEFDGSGTVCQSATNLAASVCCDTRCGCISDLSGASACAVVTVTDKNACCMGALGNCITMVTSDACNLTLNCMNLQNGNTACTVTVDGNVYTAVSCAKANDTEFSTDCCDTAVALDLADSIDDDCRAGTEACLDVTATSMCAVVTVVAACSGASSNAITLASSCATTLLTSCTTLLGGNDADTVTVNGLIYTAATATCACMGEFKVDCETDNTAATNLACVLTNDCRCGVLCDVIGCAAANVVTVTTDVLGVAGDAVALVTQDAASLAVSGSGTLACGVDADTVTINGLEYLAIDTCECACGEWDIGCSNTVAATALAVAIACDCRFPCCTTVPTHDVTGAAMCTIVTVTADAGEIGSTIPLISSDVTRLLTSGSTLTGGVGEEIFEISLVAATSGEITMNFINRPMSDGIFIDYISGTTGRLVIIFE